MKVSEVIQQYRNLLKDMYDEGELSQVIFLVFEHLKGFSKTDLVIKKDELVSDKEEENLSKILQELKTGKPIQYILGNAWFYGLKFKVNENVLIPRQETEELVDWILHDQERGDKIKVLDICTGSGCIAISVRKNLPEAEVTALDISEKALNVAKENAAANQAKVQFIQSDVLQLQTPNSELRTSFDLIVSNPPYVLESEKKEMNNRVTLFEPRLALFVLDDDPLIFYKRIADFALLNLKPNGKLYFEINEKKGKEVSELLTDKGFSDVTLKKDLNEKDRMIRATLNVRP